MGEKVFSRNPGIDLLRGLSIFLVVCHHVAIRIPLKDGVLADFLPQWLIAFFVRNGQTSVTLFFVISGFLIASNSLKRWGSLSNIDVRAFYRRRAVRILPCFFVLLAVLSLLHGLGFSDFVIRREGQSLSGALFSALFLHLNWYEGVTGYLPGNWDVLWSLSIEELFYLVFPLLCLGFKREWMLVAALSALALSMPFTREALAKAGNEIWDDKAYLPGMASIAMGVLAAIYEKRLKPKSHLSIRVIQITSALGVASVLCFEKVLRGIFSEWIYLFYTLAAAKLLLTLHWTAGRAASRGVPGLGWLESQGRLSYEIYLTHMFMVWPVVRYYKEVVSMNDGAARWSVLWYVPVVLGSWFLGWVVSKILSAPSEKFFSPQSVRGRTG